MQRVERPHSLDVETLGRFERLGPPALTPDGRHAVCSVSTPSMADNSSASSLWLLPTDRARPRRLTRCGSKDGQPAWSPQGDRVTFVAKRREREIPQRAQISYHPCSCS